jgi:hypothetical protein
MLFDGDSVTVRDPIMQFNPSPYGSTHRAGFGGSPSFLRPRFVALSQQFVVGCLKKVKRVCYPCN